MTTQEKIEEILSKLVYLVANAPTNQRYKGAAKKNAAQAILKLINEARKEQVMQDFLSLCGSLYQVDEAALITWRQSALILLEDEFKQLNNPSNESKR